MEQCAQEMMLPHDLITGVTGMKVNLGFSSVLQVTVASAVIILHARYLNPVLETGQGLCVVHVKMGFLYQFCLVDVQWTVNVGEMDGSGYLSFWHR